MAGNRGRRRKAIGAALLVAVGSVVLAAPVAAECPYVDDYPKFAKVAPAAHELFYGEVIRDEGTEGGWGRFVLRIDAVFRGPAVVGDERSFEGFWSGVPGMCDAVPLNPHIGDELAFALDARRADGLRVNGVASLDGQLEEWASGIEWLTAEQIAALAELPRTDAEAIGDGRDRATDHPEFGVPLLFIVVLVALMLHSPFGRTRPHRTGRDHR